MKLAIQILSSNPKRVFLIDGIGAFLSAMFLFAILSFFKKEFGLPQNTLYLLFIIACIFSIYSITSYYLIGKKWRTYLRIILIANMLYCVLTIMLLVISHDTVTLFGLIYFILEILTIGCIVFIELQTVSKTNQQ